MSTITSTIEVGDNDFVSADIAAYYGDTPSPGKSRVQVQSSVDTPKGEPQGVFVRVSSVREIDGQRESACVWVAPADALVLLDALRQIVEG